MSRSVKVFIIAIGMLLLGYIVHAETRYYKLLALPQSGPNAVLTVSFEPNPPKGFAEGDFYVFKILKVRGYKVDFGFCRLEVKK